MPFFGLDRLTNKSALRAEGISGIVVLGDVHGDVIQDPAQHAGRLQLRWDQLRVDQREIAWLSWRTRLSDLVGRESEKDEILLWAKEGDGVRARFVTGEGGVGKTRLAAEVAQALRDEPDGWAAGFAHQSQAGAWFTKPGGTLIILDYPEENRASVERIVEDLATFDVADRIRILFLSRRGLDYWKDTIVRATFFDREPIVLDSLEDDAAYEVYLSAQNRVPLARPRDPCRVTKDEFIDWLGRAPAHQRPLFIAAAAIHSVAHPETSVVNLAGNEVMMALVQRELGRLKRESTSNGLNDQTLGRLTAIAAVAGPLDAASLRNFADADLDLGLPPANRIVDEINRTGRLFDGLVLPPEPDILAAGLVVETFRANTAMAPEWLWAAFSAGGIERAAGRFARLAHDAETVLDILDWRLGNVLKEAVEGSIERCQSLRSAVMDPNLPQGLLPAAIATWRALGTVAGGESESAGWLNNLSVDLAGIGDRAGALEAIREAVEIRRRLARGNPARYEPELAQSLNNLSADLSESGDRAGALEAIGEAVEIYRRLARGNPARYEPELATSLNNLSNRLSESGDRAGALEAIREAVTLLEPYAAEYPKGTPARWLEVCKGTQRRLERSD